MIKKIIAGVIVLLGVAGSGVAWYTGKQAEDKIRAAVALVNVKWPLSNAFEAKVELAEYDRGIFSSTVRYRVTLSESRIGEVFNGAYEIVAKLDHGLLSLPELMSGKWNPALMVAHAELVETPATRKWFAATQGVKPFFASYREDFSGKSVGTFELAPIVKYADDKSAAALAFSGLKGEFSYDQAQAAFSVKSDDLLLKIDDREQYTLQGLTLEGSGKRGASGLYLGTQKLNIKSLGGVSRSMMPAQVVNTEWVTTTSEADNNLNIHTDLKVGKLKANDQNIIAGVKLSAALTHLDAKALKNINEIHQQATDRWLKGNMTNDSALQPTTQEQELIDDNLRVLLEGSPNFSISPLAIQTTHGVSTLNVNVVLKPAPDQDEVFHLDRLGKLEINLVVPTESVADLFSGYLQLFKRYTAQAGWDGGQRWVADVSERVIAFRLATADKDTLKTSLSYANKQLTFNGEQWSLHEFLQLVNSTRWTTLCSNVCWLLMW